MGDQAHYRSLENMYLASPINAFYRPRIEVSEDAAVIEVDVSERLFHGAAAVHGSVSFKLLDDACFFASASLEKGVFLLTSSFTVYFLRPVASGIIRSEGKVVSRRRSQCLAEAVVYDGEGRQIARGGGVFQRSRIPLHDIEGYRA